MTVARAKQIAIQQNNSAVSLIAAGDYDAAINALSPSALKTYKQIIEEADEHPQRVKTSLDQCMTQSPATQGKASSNEDESDQYIYRQAIHIPLEHIVEQTYQESAIACSSAIIFNLALAHHLSALVSAKHLSNKLHKAATLYQLAGNLQRDNAQLENNNVLFTMAAMNNLGVIYHLLEDHETATKFF